MAGRKSKYTPDTVKRLTDAITLGATYELACHYAGIHIDTFYEWQKQHPEFTETIKNAEGKGVLQWLAKIEKAASDGSWQAAAWKLERRYPQDYGLRLTLKIEPEQFALLKRHGLTPSEAWQQMMQELANADAER